MVLFEQEGEFAQKVRVTEAVLAVIFQIRLPEVMDEAPGEVRENLEGIGGYVATFGMHAVEREAVGACGMGPMESAVNADSAFIDGEDLRMLEAVDQLGFKSLQLGMALFGGVKYEGLTDGLPEQVVAHVADPMSRQQLLMLEVDEQGKESRSAETP